MIAKEIQALKLGDKIMHGETLLVVTRFRTPGSYSPLIVDGLTFERVPLFEDPTDKYWELAFPPEAWPLLKKA